MCIKSAPYLHQKRANLALNRVLLLCFSPDVAYYLKVQFWHNFFNNAKFAQNNQILCIFIVNNTKQMHFLHHCRKLRQIRYPKGAGTKMHNRLVGISTLHKTIVKNVFFNNKISKLILNKANIPTDIYIIYNDIKFTFLSHVKSFKNNLTSKCYLSLIIVTLLMFLY